MIISENRFIYFNSPERGGEVLVPKDNVEKTEVFSGAKMVDTVATALEQEGAENYSADEIKDYFNLDSLKDRQRLIGYKAIEDLLLLV